MDWNKLCFYDNPISSCIRSASLFPKFLVIKFVVIDETLFEGLMRDFDTQVLLDIVTLV